MANHDIAHLHNYIVTELSLPKTADTYIDGIYKSIDSLADYAHVHPVSQRVYLQILYGPLARTIRYKRMTIVYNIIGSMVFIRRVMAGRLIR